MSRHKYLIVIGSVLFVDVSYQIFMTKKQLKLDKNTGCPFYSKMKKMYK
jgi:hypothetical protein